LGFALGGLLLLWLIAAMANMIVYIDGFNLYYRALLGSPHKWLDIEALSRTSLPAGANVVRVNYYTAHVSGRLDKDAPIRQHAYLKALRTLPLVHIHFGKFMTNQKWAGLVAPAPQFRPVPTTLQVVPAPVVVFVWKTEEKGSDVNLGVHLVRDAFQGAFEEAAILTNDTDLCEPMRIVRDDVGLPITLLTPVANPHKSLTAVATHIRHIGPYLGPCQFPDPVQTPKGPVAKPASW
jgi:hypothetical protein